MRTAFIATIALMCVPESFAQDHTERTLESNVIYGMYSGLALLMDIHYPSPEQANGYGIVFIQGCGWHQSTERNTGQMKEGGAITSLALPLSQQGFTVFTVNHRAAPRFRYPAPLEDVQRAVQFIRHHHEDYGIASDRIAAVGGSSGGHLASLLGLLPGKGDSSSEDPIRCESSRVQCVVALAPETDLLADELPPHTQSVIASFLGQPRFPEGGAPPGLDAVPQVYIDASPISHVAQDAAAFLLIHGEEDTVAPCSQSANLCKRLREVRAVVEYHQLPGLGHGIPPLVTSGVAGTDPKAIGDWILARLSAGRR